jgi:hypothetical protein
MRKIVAALVAGLAVAAHADATFDNGTVAIRLLTSPCGHPVLAQMLADAVPGPSFDATVTFQGRKVAACWVALPGDQVGILDEDGDSGAVPLGAFK